MCLNNKMYSKSQQFQKKNSCKTIINFSNLNLLSSSQFKSFPSISIIILNWIFLIRHYGLQLVISHTANPDINALRHVSFKSIEIHKATHWPYSHTLALGTHWPIISAFGLVPQSQSNAKFLNKKIPIPYQQ